MTYAEFRRFELARVATFLAVALLVSLLAGCAGTMSVTPPGDRTQLDERSAIVAEASWRAAGTIAEAGLDVELLKGNAAVRGGEIDAGTEAAIGVLRAAYDAGNAHDYFTAALSVTAAVEQLERLGESWRSGEPSGFAFDTATLLKIAAIAPVIIGSGNELRETISSLGGMAPAEQQGLLARLREQNDQARFRRIAKFAAAAGR